LDNLKDFANNEFPIKEKILIQYFKFFFTFCFDFIGNLQTLEIVFGFLSFAIRERFKHWVLIITTFKMTIEEIGKIKVNANIFRILSCHLGENFTYLANKWEKY